MSGSPGDGQEPDPAARDDELDRLRQLLVGDERERLSALEDRLNDPRARAGELGRVLPEALVAASHESGRLPTALAPSVEVALGVLIKRNRRQLADAISPAMGPAIRRAITEVLRGMVDSLNSVLQSSFSVRGLRWRLESWRSGRSFAEVVLSHSLVFKVEQVFLVHRPSGLLLDHVSADPAAARDGDLISGMLTAIQDFVKDSFAVAADEAVDSLRVGDLTVLVEQGSDAYLAAVVRGSPHPSLRRLLKEALEAIHLEQGEALASYAGDSAAFSESRHHLEGCLQMQLARPVEPRRWLAPAVVAALVALVAAGALWGSLRRGREWASYLRRLADEPGLTVLSSDRGWRSYVVSGLRDPLATDPARILEGFRIPPEKVTGRWQPYQSLSPQLVVERASRLLDPPAGVTLSFEEGTLTVAGAAPHRWVVEGKRRALAVPGVERLSLDHLEDEGLVRLAAVRDRLERELLLFEPGAAAPPRSQDPVFERILAAVAELANLAREEGLPLRIDVVGRTDGTGSERTNMRLSRLRAEWTVSALEGRGVREVRLAIVGVGTSDPLRNEETAEGRAANRSVTFLVAVDE